MRAASTAGEGDADRVSHSKRINSPRRHGGRPYGPARHDRPVKRIQKAPALPSRIRLDRTRSAGRGAKQIATNGGSDGKQPGVLAGEAHYLQAQWQTAGREQRQRQRRDTD